MLAESPTPIGGTHRHARNNIRVAIILGEEKEINRREEEEKIRMENILSGNPLLKEKYAENAKSDMKVKRRWDDDVVFKNCSRAEPEAKEPTFINDSLRNEFHQKFMNKYIK